MSSSNITGVLMRGGIFVIYRHMHREESTIKNTDTKGNKRSRWEFCSQKPKNTWSYQKLEEPRKDSPLGVSKRAWLFRHYELVLLASKL